MDQVARRGGLRTQLLVGVAAVALAAPLSKWAQAQDAAKWSPYIELGGMGGNTHSFGDVDIFIPLWQDQTSLLFGDFRGTFSTEPSQEGNFGLGYRTQLNTDWILGGYGYFDIQNSKNDNLYYQATLGVELLSVDWDFRLNGYIPFNPDGGTVDNSVGIGISGNNIQMQTSTTKEKALYGLDGEVGWRVPVFPVDGDMDIRVFAGGYFFTNSDVDTIAGPRGRIEARLYDIEFLGLQSRLTAQGVIQWDQPRGTQGFGGLELRIPLGAITGTPGPKLNPLDRRMVDRVQRDVDIVTEKTAAKSRNEDVIVDELRVSTHTIVFDNSGGTGNGTKNHEIDLNAAPGLAPGLNGGTGSNAIILADGAAGTIGVTNPLQLLSGQALIGGNSKVLLTGAKTGEQVNFRFPGTRPTLAGSTSTANLIQMQPGDQNEVFGLNLTGAFSNGVFGSNMYRAIVKQTSIDSPAADGILLSNTNPVTSQFVHIEDNTVTSAGSIGIHVASLLDNGSSFSQTIIIDDNTVTDSTRQGIYIYAGVKGESFLSQNVSVHSNTVTGSGSDGIKVGLFVSNASANQSVGVTDNIAEGNVSAGIYVGAVARSSGSITQTALVASNTVTSNGRSGIYFSNRASSGGTISSKVEITDNTATGNASNGIYVNTNARISSTISQTLVIRGNTAESNGRNGIYVDVFASVGSTISQNATIADNLVEHNGRNGLYVNVGERSSSTVIQNLTAYNNTASFNTSSGIRLNAYGATGGSVSQTAVLTDNVVVGNTSNGIYVRANFSTGATLSQDIVIDPSIISDNLGAGILIHSRLYDGSFTQNVSILDNLITSNSGGGIVVDNVVGNRSDGATTTLWQGITVSGNTIAYNGGQLSVTSAGNITVNVTGGGVDLSLFANNFGSSGTVNLSSSIEIADNIFSSNFVRYAGTSGAFSFGLNLNVLQSGSNGGNNGTVNMVGNTLTVENNSFAEVRYSSGNGVSRGFDMVIQAFAINDAGGGGVVSGAVNLLNNTTTIRGNSLGTYIVLNSMGVNGSSSSGVTAGGISFANNVTTVQDNIFDKGGVFASNLLVNGTDGADVSGGRVALANNTMTIEGNTDGRFVISNNLVNGSDHSGVSGGNAIMASNHTTIDGNSGAGVFIFNQVVNGSDNSGITGGGAAMSSNVTTITDNFFSFGGISIVNLAGNGSPDLFGIGSSDGSTITSGVVTMTSNTLTIAGNAISAGSIFVENLGVNGSLTNGVTGGGVTLASNLVTVASNQIHYEAQTSSIARSMGIFVINQVVNGTDSAGVSGGGAVLSSNVVSITDNLLEITTAKYTSSGALEIVVEMLGQNGDDSGAPTSSVVTLANNGITVTNNRLLYTGNLGFAGTAAIAVIDAVSAASGTGGGINLSDHIVISTNTITGYDLGNSSGLFVFVAAGNDASSGGTAIAVENTSITGNQIAGPIVMAAEVGNSASNGAASMTNNFTIAGNTASRGIFVLNEADNEGSNGAVSMGNFFSITDNVVVGDSLNLGGIAVFNVVGNSDSNGAGANVSMTNNFSINDNSVSGGVLVFDEAVNGTSSTPVAGTVKMSNTVTIERNTIVGDSFGVLVLDNAFNTGGTVSLSTALDIEQNVVSGASSAGMQFVVYSTSSAVSQGAQLKNNTISGNGLYIGSSLGGFGIAFIAHQTGAGAAIQNFTLSGNVVTDNTSDGINSKASGAGAAQTISLAAGSGNHINANAGFGAYLSNNGGTVVFNINLNDLSGNSDGPFSTAGAGVTVNP